MSNSLIELLTAYGPIPEGNAMYDERVRDAAAAAGHAPLEIPETRSEEVAQCVAGPSARSVILTGTAGDGKTFTARRAFERLAPASVVWSDEAEQAIEVDGRQVVFVKDLSELDVAQRNAIMPRLIDALTNPSSPELFVLCANDGQLLRVWREVFDPRAEGVARELAAMLHEDRAEPRAELAFHLVNMSRQSRAAALDAVLAAMLEHASWSDCPGGCPGLDGAMPCPIRLNRAILLETGDSTMRERLRQLIEIAAADDDHLSLRQVMILVVNALLGDSKNPQDPLLTCARARNRAASGEYRYTNPFANVLGDNHPVGTRARVAAFAALSRYGVGDETNNRFDDALLDPDPAPDLPDHPQYGVSLIRQVKADYLEEPNAHIAKLRPLLRDQRRRLFFTAPEPKRQDGPWSLTLLHAGAPYVELLTPGTKSPDGQTKAMLVRGLNRVLSGALTETDDRLWLPQPSGAFLGRVVPLMLGDPIGWGGFGPRLVLERPAQAGRPPLLRVQAPASHGGDTLGELALTPSLFEYLSRVAGGALPTSFSNECLQEVRSFQIQVAGGLEVLLAGDGAALKLVRTEGDQLEARDVGVLHFQVTL